MRRLLGFVVGLVLGAIMGAIASIAIEQFYGDLLRRLFAEWAQGVGLAFGQVEADQWEALGINVLSFLIWLLGVPLAAVHVLILRFVVVEHRLKKRDGGLLTLAGVSSGLAVLCAAVVLVLFGVGLLGGGLAALVLVGGMATSALVLQWRDVNHAEAVHLEIEAQKKTDHEDALALQHARDLADIERVVRSVVDRAAAQEKKSRWRGPQRRPEGWNRKPRRTGHTQ